MKLKPDGPKPVEDTYGSGQNPPARPKSNHNENYGKSVYNSNFDAAKMYKTVKKTMHEKPKQIPAIDKGLTFKMEEVPSFKQAMKKDKHSA